jgi:hypothetical protein
VADIVEIWGNKSFAILVVDKTPDLKNIYLLLWGRLICGESMQGMMEMLTLLALVTAGIERDALRTPCGTLSLG